MPFDPDSYATASFKRLNSLSHIGNTVQPANENAFGYQLTFSELVAAEVVDPTPATAVTDGTVELVTFDLTPIVASNGLAYEAKFPTGYSPGGTGAADGDLMRDWTFAIPGTFAGPAIPVSTGWGAVLRDGASAVISAGDQSDWFFDTSTGIVTAEQNTGDWPPATIQCYIYIGQTLDTTLGTLTAPADATMVNTDAFVFADANDSNLPKRDSVTDVIAMLGAENWTFTGTVDASATSAFIMRVSDTPGPLGTSGDMAIDTSVSGWDDTLVYRGSEATQMNCLAMQSTDHVATTGDVAAYDGANNKLIFEPRSRYTSIITNPASQTLTASVTTSTTTDDGDQLVLAEGAGILIDGVAATDTVTIAFTAPDTAMTSSDSFIFHDDDDATPKRDTVTDVIAMLGAESWAWTGSSSTATVSNLQFNFGPQLWTVQGTAYSLGATDQHDFHREFANGQSGSAATPTPTVSITATTADIEFTGMNDVAAGTPSTREVVLIHYLGTDKITFTHNDSSSTSGRRFFMPNARSIFLTQGQYIVFQYETLINYWIPVCWTGREFGSGDVQSYTMSGTETDFAWDGSRTIEFDPNGDRTLDGIANGYDGAQITVMNSGGLTGEDITVIEGTSGSAAAGNEIYGGTGGNWKLQYKECMELRYSPALSGWLVTK